MNSKQLAFQIFIGITTGVAATVLSYFVLEKIRESRANAPLPQRVVPGYDSV